LTLVKHNVVVVSNYPDELQQPDDLPTHNIMRCIGLPGDTFSIKDSQAYVNVLAVENPEGMQFNYYISTKSVINDRVFHEHKIREYGFISNIGYSVITTHATDEKMRALSFIDDVHLKQMSEEEAEQRI